MMDWTNGSLNGIDYSCIPNDTGMDVTLDETKTNKYIESLKSKGGWIEDDECAARLIYANGRFVPSLSIVLCNFISGNMIPECTVLRLNCIDV